MLVIKIPASKDPLYAARDARAGNETDESVMQSSIKAAVPNANFSFDKASREIVISLEEGWLIEFLVQQGLPWAGVEVLGG